VSLYLDKSMLIGLFIFLKSIAIVYSVSHGGHHTSRAASIPAHEDRLRYVLHDVRCK
jgi:hypothetical protein